MKTFRALVAPLLLLSVVSCDKAARLRQERADIEARIMQGHYEMRDIDAKIAVYGQDAELAEISFHQQKQEAAARSKQLEAKISTLTKECSEAETALSQLRPLIDAYRAQNAR